MNYRKNKGLRMLLPLLVLLVFSAFTGGGEADEVLQRILQKLESYRQNQQPEKIYLHTDREIYAAGDTVWFKAYVVNAATHQPIFPEQIARLYLLASDTKTIREHKFLVQQGQASGAFVLPENSASDTYTLQAFTNRMRNASPDLYFSKPLQIIGLTDKEDLPETVAPKEIADLQFFPEGGNLVAGLTSRVAFKATAANGLGTEVQGEILEENGNAVATFASSHLGMGYFNFRPEKGKTYTVRTLTKNSLKNIIFPKVLDAGYSLAVTNSADSTFAVVVQASPDIVKQKEKQPVKLVIQVRGVVYFTAAASLAGKPFIRIEFPKSKLPDGIAQVTLFNAQGLPEAERLFFNDLNRNLNISLKPDKPQYQRREEVKLQVEVTDDKGNPVAANLSLAVTDAALQSQKISPSTTILSSLLLTSDLAGMVEQPAYYFANPTPETRKNLDLLMLTQGWRRFSWKDVLLESPKLPEFKPEKELLLKGSVISGSKNIPLANATLYVMVSSTGDAYKTTTDNQGNFEIALSDYPNEQVLLYQVYVQDVLQPDIKLQLEDPKLKTAFAKTTGINPDAAFLRQQARNRQLINQAFITNSQKPKPALAVHSQANTPSDYTFKVADYESFGSLQEFIREVISPVSLVTKNGRKEPRVFSRERNNTFFTNQPLYLINGYPTLNTDFILALSNDQIRTIEVISSISILQKFGYFGQNGAIAIYTQNSAIKPADIPLKDALLFQGLLASRQFYTPKYTPANPRKRMPDFRPTLFWQPNLRTDAQGKATVTFFASDDIGSFSVTGEGLSATGKAGTGTAVFKIMAPQ